MTAQAVSRRSERRKRTGLKRAHTLLKIDIAERGRIDELDGPH